MKHTMAIFKREMQAYFNSAIAYIVIIVFLGIAGWFFASNMFLINQATVRQIVSIVLPLIMFFFVPAISMRLLAEEKRSGTLELLVTMPLESAEIVMGKFLASLSLLVIALFLTLPYVITITILGNPDLGTIFSGYIGLFLLGASYLAIGIFASSVTKNQIVSFIISFIILLVLFMLDKVTILFSGPVANIIQYISTDFHFQNIARGVLDSRDLIYFFSLIIFFLFLSNRALESIKK